MHYAMFGCHISVLGPQQGILGDPGVVSGAGEKSKRARKKIDFSLLYFFLASLDFSPAPLTAPGSSRMTTGRNYNRDIMSTPSNTV